MLSPKILPVKSQPVKKIRQLLKKKRAKLIRILTDFPRFMLDKGIVPHDWVVSNICQILNEGAVAYPSSGPNEVFTLLIANNSQANIRERK